MCKYGSEILKNFQRKCCENQTLSTSTVRNIFNQRKTQLFFLQEKE